MKNNTSIIHKRKLKKYFSVFALALSMSSFAQTMTENYVYSKVRLSEDGSKKAEAIQYYDGLGRPKQAIQVKSTPLGQDLVVPITYDQLGRQTKSILPVPMPTTNLGIQTVSEATANAYYGVPNAYAEQKLEASPLSRVLETASPGTEWGMNSGHTVKATYEINKNSDKVKKFSFTNSWVSATTVSSVPTVSYYNEKVLVKNSGTDEDGNKTIEFTTGLGQTILVRKVISATENADTYYLYNDYGQLIYVISPKAEAQITSNNNVITQQILDDLCYQYKYDNKGRLVEKKIPGKGWEYMVYDKQNRLVLSQDANLRATTNNFGSKGWMFTKYDQFGRVVYTGFFANTGTRTAMQTALNNMTANFGNNEKRSTTPITQNGMDIYYTKDAFPTGSMTILGVNYYDTYPAYNFNPVFPSNIAGKAIMTDNSTENVSTRTLPVMSLVKNIEDHNWTKSYSYYDIKGRPVGRYSINHLGGYTSTESELDFTGLPIQVKTYHKRLTTDTERIITETFTYDNQNRLLTHTHQVDSNTPELLTQNKYNELSQLVSKKVGGTSAASPLQTVDYTYNIRGWLTKINDPANLGNDLFGYKIKYTQVEGLQIPNIDYPNDKVLPKYNGNIAEIDWKTASADNDVKRRYGYTYDSLNRLAAGYYQPDNNPAGKEYFERPQYDLNGNITQLKRSAQSVTAGVANLIDDLEYTYTGNQLNLLKDYTGNWRGVDNNYAQFAYDANGNMVKDDAHYITEIKYNHLDLPSHFQKKHEYSKYIYRADGTKVYKEFYNEDEAVKHEYFYIDGFQYHNNTLQFVPTAEGYYNFENNKYIYSYTDHLGNVRLSYFKNGSSIEVLEENNYYPFGLKHDGYNTLAGNPAYKYRYNGKELQETGVYDYGARFYMPDMGRWGVIDPLAEASRRFTPYHYGNNNPIMFIDPDGRITESFIKGMLSAPSGTTWYNTGIGFTNDQGGSIDYDGNRINWGMDYTRMLMQSVGLSPGGEGGGGEMVIHIPEVIITGSLAIDFGLQMRNHVNDYMAEWNAQSDLAWKKWSCPQCFDGPINYIGSAGDPAGVFDIGGQVMSTWKPENRYLAMGAGILAAVALRKPGLATKEAIGTYYSVAFEMKLAEGSYPGVYRGGHFREANKALEAMMKTDAKFAASIDELGIVIPKSPTGSILGKSPKNWVWHHHVDDGIMQLVPKPQHTVGSSFWKTMHPGNKGGFSIWGK
ncbi:DUF6443 domain-containing protein [Chryseobacterium gleum]|uniref:DUF6443 domain-containing protein n=1 Tax=Chryseobacterium gleum TaxID=250 RepID=UPI00241D9466|nr:DUF6443 domain-containing protein [Chryseobacterium gleum]